MNNKILAITLSIIAVIVVVYQIFLREDEDQIKKNRPVQFVKPMNTESTSPLMNNDIDKSDISDDMDDKEFASKNFIIDLYSPQLLQRVKPYIKNTNIELSGEFGANIFGYKKKKIETKAEKNKEMKTPILTLNGIIELINDNIIIAIINNRLYNRGEVIENAIILKIEKYKVFLKFNEETIILTVDHGTYKGWIKKENGGNL